MADNILYIDDSEYVRVIMKGDKLLITTNRGAKIAEVKHPLLLRDALNRTYPAPVNDAPTFLSERVQVAQ